MDGPGGEPPFQRPENKFESPEKQSFGSSSHHKFIPRPEARTNPPTDLATRLRQAVAARGMKIFGLTEEIESHEIDTYIEEGELQKRMELMTLEETEREREMKIAAKLAIEDVRNTISTLGCINEQMLTINSDNPNIEEDLDKVRDSIKTAKNQVRSVENQMDKLWGNAREVETQTPKHWLTELLPGDSKRVNRFFAELPRPRLESDESKNPLIIVVTHLFAHHIPYLEAMKQRGQLGMVIAKGASRDPEVIKYFRRLGIPVVDFGRDVTGDPKAIARELHRVLKPGQSLRIFDHGGYFKEIDEIQRELGEEHKFEAICEVTKNGVDKYKAKQELKALHVPVIQLNNKLKNTEDVMIGPSILYNAQKIVAPHNINIHEKNALVIGYGPIGQSIVKQLKKNTKIVDIDSHQKAQATIEGHPPPVTESELGQALGEAEVVYCAGNKSIKSENFKNLRNGCLVVLATSADDAIDEIPHDYEEKDMGHNLYKYESKQGQHFFYLLGKGAANFVDLEPAVGNSIYAVHAMEIMALYQMSMGKFEMPEGVQELLPELQRNSAEAWLVHYGDSKLLSPEILRQRHVREEINNDTFNRMSKKLDDSIAIEKKFASSEPFVNPFMLEDLRRRYVLGEINDDTFDEMHIQLELSIEIEKDFVENELSVDASALGFLRRRYALGKLKNPNDKNGTATFKMMSNNLEDSIEDEIKFARDEPSVDTSALGILREQYALGDLKNPNDENGIEAFKQMHEELNKAIRHHIDFAKMQPLVNGVAIIDASALVILQRRYALGEIDSPDFKERLQNLKDSIEIEKDFVEYSSSVDVSALKLLRRQYAQGEIDSPIFEERHPMLEASIWSERLFALGNQDPLVQRVLDILQKDEQFKDNSERDPLVQYVQDTEQPFANNQDPLVQRVLKTLPAVRRRYANMEINTQAFEEMHTLPLFPSYGEVDWKVLEDEGEASQEKTSEAKARSSSHQEFTPTPGAQAKLPTSPADQVRQRVEAQKEYNKTQKDIWTEKTRKQIEWENSEIAIVKLMRDTINAINTLHNISKQLSNFYSNNAYNISDMIYNLKIAKSQVRSVENQIGKLSTEYVPISKKSKEYPNKRRRIADSGNAREEVGTQTPKHWLTELLPEDSERVDRFFAELPRPRRESDESKNPLTVVVTHFFAHHIPYLEAMRQRGQLGMVIADETSRDPDVIEYFRRLRIPVVDFGRDVTEDPKAIARELHKVLKPGQSIRIFDYGGYFQNVDEIQRELGEEHKVKAICEVTESGVDKYKAKQELKALHVPVIQLNDNKLKDAKNVMIGPSILYNAQKIVAPHNINIHERNALVIGYGSIGQSIVKQLKKIPKIVDIDSHQEAGEIPEFQATIEGHPLPVTESELGQALGEAEVVYCAGNKSIKSENFKNLRNGCLVVLATSANNAIEKIPDDYEEKDMGHNLYKYENKQGQHDFYLLGKGAVNFVDLEPAVGNSIYAVHAMEIMALYQMSMDKFEMPEGVQELLPELQRESAKAWLAHYGDSKLLSQEIRHKAAGHDNKLIHYGDSKLLSQELLRQRHVREEINNDTFNRMSKNLKASIVKEKKYANTEPFVDPFMLEILRRRYALGNLGKPGDENGTATFQEMHKNLEASIEEEIDLARDEPSVDASMLGILRRRYALGNLKNPDDENGTDAFKHMHNKLGDSLDDEIMLADECARNEELSMDISMLGILRRRYALGEIDDDTLQEMHKNLEASIDDEIDFVLDEQFAGVDISMMGILRERYALGNLKNPDDENGTATFKERGERLEKSIKDENDAVYTLAVDIHENTVVVDVSTLGILRRRYALGEIDTTNFEEMEAHLKEALWSERDIVEEFGAASLFLPDTSPLRILQERYLQDKCKNEEFEDKLSVLVSFFNYDKKCIEYEKKCVNNKDITNFIKLANMRNHIQKMRSMYMADKINLEAFDNQLMIIERFLNEYDQLNQSDANVLTGHGLFDG